METEPMTVCHCNCGAVAFAIEPPLSEIFVCHCSICRRFTGSGGIPVVIVENSRFRWLQGRDHVRLWSKPDADWEANFCAICGSSLPGRNDDERTFVPAGLLPPDIETLTVGHHIFVGSKAPWDEIGDNGKQHENAFGG